MYICKECWNESLKWVWQCPFCKSWWTMQEFKEDKLIENKIWEEKIFKNINEIKQEKKLNLIKTSSSELNNVLWNWIISGSVILLTWEPWIWKSTLSLQLASFVKNKKIIYISWEETEYQISQRANRLKISWENLLLLSESNIENILASLKKNKCDILIIDSISVMYSENISGTAWSLSQVRYISEILTHYAKTTNTAIFIIWHINKEWSIAWPKTLEHMVDTVLFFEGEKYDNIRILRSLKNRFWNTSEIWIFQMWEYWLKDLANPSEEFISNTESIGSSLSITIKWTRALLIETESLTTYTKFGYPKRSSRWINNSKLDLIIAVLSKYTSIKLDSYDVYTNIVRGLKIDEPGIDLSIASSIISSKLNKKIPKNMVFIWEISLTGQIKKPIMLEKRIKEAQKLWFEKIITSKTNLKNKKNLIEIENIKELEKLI